MTDYEALRSGLEQAIPFNVHAGLEVVEVAEGRGVVRLPDDEKLHNHVGSQHAGGLFAAGEAASGAAFVSVFAEHMGELTALASRAEIEYEKLAKGPIDATGTLDADKDDLLEEIKREGKVEFPVRIELANGDGDVVAKMTVHWHVRRNS